MKRLRPSIWSGSFESGALIAAGCILGAAMVVLVAFVRGWLS